MVQAKITEYVDSHKKELLDAISTLVRIPSTKGEPQPEAPFGEGPNTALLTALEIANSMGFATQNHNGYVGTIDFSKNVTETALDILAHLDVVPAPASEWTVCEPFDPLIKDGKLYGRGTSDDKGPAMCALFAMKAIKDCGIPLKKNIRLILGTDEESGSQDIAYYYKTHQTAPATFSPDANFPVINVEKGRFNGNISATFETSTSSYVVSVDCGVRSNVIPDQAEAVIAGLTQAEVLSVAKDWEMQTGCKLSITENNQNFVLSVIGIGGHAAHPETANNALTALLALLASLPFSASPQHDAIVQLSSIFPHNDWRGEAAGIAMEDDISEYLTICLNLLKITPTTLSATFDSRTPICSTQENTVDVLTQKITEKNLILENISTNAPHHIPLESPFVQTLLHAYEQYSGLKGYGTVTGGGTYVHGLENAVAFGASLPDTDNNIHGVDEFAVIEELLLSTKIFAQVIVDLCGE